MGSATRTPLIRDKLYARRYQIPHLRQQSLAAGLATLPFAFAFENVGDVVPIWRLALSLAYLTLFVSIFAYLLWFHLLNV